MSDRTVIAANLPFKMCVPAYLRNIFEAVDQKTGDDTSVRLERNGLQRPVSLSELNKIVEPLTEWQPCELGPRHACALALSFCIPACTPASRHRESNVPCPPQLSVHACGLSVWSCCSMAA